MPQVPSERPVGIKKGGQFIAEVVCKPALITDRRPARPALLGLLAGLTKVFEPFSPHCCPDEAIFGSRGRSVCILLESLPPPYENQSHRASGLNLLVAAIILWNTVYLQRAVDHLHSQGYEPTPSDLAHLSPLGWEHINLTGDYHWETAPSFGPDQFRPLRTHAYDFAAAA